MMAVPKRRTSRARPRSRRATWGTATPTLTRCPQCSEPKRPHYVCPHCGYYRGRQAVAVGEEE